MALASGVKQSVLLQERQYFYDDGHEIEVTAMDIAGKVIVSSPRQLMNRRRVTAHMNKAHLLRLSFLAHTERMQTHAQKLLDSRVKRTGRSRQ